METRAPVEARRRRRKFGAVNKNNKRGVVQNKFPEACGPTEVTSLIAASDIDMMGQLEATVLYRAL